MERSKMRIKNIAVVTGGSAAERGISLLSADVVCQYLDKSKFTPYKVVLNEKEWIVEAGGKSIATVDKNDFSATINGSKILFDKVFVALHGTPAEDGKLQGYFDLLNISYNCCGVLQAALTFDKFRCKEYLQNYGVNVAKGKVFRAGEEHNFNVDFEFPVFVKPNKNGSSYGASKVDEKATLENAVNEAFKYDDEVIVEEYLKGIEVTCGVLKINGKPTALPLTEIRSKNAFFDFEAKYKGESKEVTPAEISNELTEAIQKTSVRVYDALGMKGMCRIDYIVKNNTHYLLEVNSIPGLTVESLVPQQARAFGLSLTELFTISLEG
ncbi:MAG TPA: D-alanine--D-alanine ligase [Chitinophagales bacterium]|nr:D-alanine--D-alanine ligase [Chitinophagales bacterium]